LAPFFWRRKRKDARASGAEPSGSGADQRISPQTMKKQRGSELERIVSPAGEVLLLVLPRRSCPLRRPAAPGALCCSGATGGCGTRAVGPQTVLAIFPVAPCAARRRRGQPENRSSSHRSVHQAPFGVLAPHTTSVQLLRHPGAGRDPVRAPKTWIPAFAGMTNRWCAYGSRKTPTLGRLLASYTQNKNDPRVRRGTQRLSDHTGVGKKPTNQNP